MPVRTRRTKIVATIGPACRDPETLRQMIDEGMDVARLNFSHGTAEEHAATVGLIRDAANAAGRPIAILQDLPGPKLRIGRVQGNRVELETGSDITFECGTTDGEGTQRRMTVAIPALAQAVHPGEVMYLADGAVRLRVTATRPAECEVDTRVEFGGVVVSRQGLNVPGEAEVLPAVAAEDLTMLEAGERMGVDLIGLSFVRRASDVTDVREHTRLPLVAKMEKPQAIDRMAEIVEASDCIMVARGDLGIELPIEEVPIVQKKLLRLCGSRARPSITATQMLDSMVVSSRPTRAEVADVANAILDGSDAVMLSQETAIGAHPVAAVSMMAAIARTTERELPSEHWNAFRVVRDKRDPAYTVAHSACIAARELELDALVVPTLSGRSARLVSAHRPTVPIYALSPGKETVRRCGLMWGVQAAPMRRVEVTEQLIAEAARRVVELGWCQPGQRVGMTAGLPSGRPGSTSLFQVQQL